MSEDPATHEHPVTPLGRTARSLLWRRWPEFVIEFILIIVGILTALAIDGWVQDRKDGRTEIAYLELLRDDLVQIEGQLQDYVDFETGILEDGVALFHALDSSNSERDPLQIQAGISRLGARKTLQIVSAAFTDLQSTGNLQVIRDRGLRQQIVGYFFQAERTELIIEKNNTAFVDRLYLPFMLNMGVTNGYAAPSDLNLVDAEAQLTRALGDDVAWPYDEILEEPPEASSWDALRRQILFRAKIASIGVTAGRRAIDATREIRAAIEEELRNSI